MGSVGSMESYSPELGMHPLPRARPKTLIGIGKRLRLIRKSKTKRRFPIFVGQIAVMPQDIWFGRRAFVSHHCPNSISVGVAGPRMKRLVSAVGFTVGFMHLPGQVVKTAFHEHAFVPNHQGPHLVERSQITPTAHMKRDTFSAKTITMMLALIAVGRVLGFAGKILQAWHPIMKRNESARHLDEQFQLAFHRPLQAVNVSRYIAHHLFFSFAIAHKVCPVVLAKGRKLIPVWTPVITN